MLNLPPAWVTDILEPVTCALLIGVLGAIYSATGERHKANRGKPDEPVTLPGSSEAAPQADPQRGHRPPQRGD